MLESENNHFFKKSMLKKWLINKKFYYISKTDFYKTGLFEIKELGSGKADTQFTSLLINQETEKKIKTNLIENNFESAANIYVHNNDFVHPKYKEEDKINEREKNIKILLDACTDYLSMQIIRNPYNLNHYFEIFKKSLEDNSQIFNLSLFLMSDRQKAKEIQEHTVALSYKQIFDQLPEHYETLFLQTKDKIGSPIELYMVTSESNTSMFHLSEGNTTTLFKLLSECEISTWCSITPERLKNMYITCLSPKLLLIINCNEQYCTDNEIDPIKINIKKLWNNYIIKEALDKIILAENININEIINILNSPISQSSKEVAEIFQKNESIYKKYTK
jgi:hypothetical protein